MRMKDSVENSLDHGNFYGDCYRIEKTYELIDGMNPEDYRNAFSFRLDRDGHLKNVGKYKEDISLALSEFFNRVKIGSDKK